MENLIMFQLLFSLSKEEFLNFEPFFTSLNPDSKEFDFYIQIAQLYEKSAYNWDKFKMKIQSNEAKPYTFFNKSESAVHQRKIRSTFLKKLEKYCAFLQLNTEGESALFTLKFLKERNLIGLFEKKLKRLKSDIQSESISNYFAQFIIEELHFDYELKNNVGQRSSSIHLIYQYFDRYAKAKYQQLKSSLLVSKKIKSETSIESLENPIKSYYLKTQDLFLSKSDALFYELKEELYTDSNLDETEKANFCGLLINFCLSKLNKDSTINYSSEIMQLSDFMYIKGLMKSGRYIPVMHIKNYLGLATTRINRKDNLAFSKEQVLQLIKEFRQYTVPQYRYGVYRYNLGVFYFYTKDFKKAIQILNEKALYANSFFNYDSKLILMRCYFEVNKLEALELLSMRFNHMLKKDQALSKSHLEEYQNARLCIEKLYDYKLLKVNRDMKNKVDLLKDTLIQDIKTKPMKVKNWIYQQYMNLT